MVLCWYEKDEIYLRREIGAFPFYNGPVLENRNLPYDWKVISKKLEQKLQPDDVKLRLQTNGLDILTYFNMNENDLINIESKVNEVIPGTRDYISDKVDTYKQINDHIQKFKNRDTKDIVSPGSNITPIFEITKKISREGIGPRVSYIF